jgi:hypothetical protein
MVVPDISEKVKSRIFVPVVVEDYVLQIVSKPADEQKKFISDAYANVMKNCKINFDNLMGKDTFGPVLAKFAQSKGKTRDMYYELIWLIHFLHYSNRSHVYNPETKMFTITPIEMVERYNSKLPILKMPLINADNTYSYDNTKKAIRIAFDRLFDDCKQYALELNDDRLCDFMQTNIINVVYECLA